MKQQQTKSAALVALSMDDVEEVAGGFFCCNWNRDWCGTKPPHCFPPPPPPHCRPVCQPHPVPCHPKPPCW
jgi:hypothetical protein